MLISPSNLHVVLEDMVDHRSSFEIFHLVKVTFQPNHGSKGHRVVLVGGEVRRSKMFCGKEHVDWHGEIKVTTVNMFYSLCEVVLRFTSGH